MKSIMMKTTALLFVFLLGMGSVMGAATFTTNVSSVGISVRINEVMYNPTGSEVEGEWLELFNNGSEAVNVTGWVVTDQDGSDDFVFPQMEMPPGAFVVLHAGSGNNTTDFDSGPAHFYLFKHSAFLSNTGDDICLMNGSAVVDYVAYGNSTSIDRSPDLREFIPVPAVAENETIGRLNDTWGHCIPTPGFENREEVPPVSEASNDTGGAESTVSEPESAPQSSNATDTESPLGDVVDNTTGNYSKPAEAEYAPLLITDVYYYSLLSESFTIYNPTEEEVSLLKWSFSDGEGTVFLPDNASIGPLSHLTLAQNAEGYFEESGLVTDLNWSAMKHSGTFRMNNNGDELLLYCGSLVVDAYVYGDSEYCGTGWVGEPALPFHSTQVAHRAIENGSCMDTNTSADWDHIISGIGRSSFPPFSVSGRMNITAFSSPDNSYEVLAGAIDSANYSILLNVYEFTSYPLSNHIISAADRGVNITMLLEGGPVGGLPEEEISLCQRMHSAGIDIRFMVNDYANKINDRYRFDHAKYMVIDGSRLVIMSENMGSDGFSPAHTGNRGWGLVIDSPELAGYFAQVFENDSASDMRDIAHIEDMPFYSSDIGFYPHQPVTSPIIEPMAYSGNASVTAVLSPDTSLSEDTVLGMIKSARKSVYVEQFYIYRHWGSRYTGSVSQDPNPYLEAVIDAARRGCEVRVILDNTWYNIDPNSSVDNDDTVEYVNSLAEEGGLNMKAKIISDCHNFTHLHNKGVIVDNRSVLVSSINWNENSVKENREAGVIVKAEPVASYFVSLFEKDWISEPLLSVTLGDDVIMRENESVRLVPRFSVSAASVSGVVWSVGNETYDCSQLNMSFPASGTYNITVVVSDIYGRTAHSFVSVVVLPALAAHAKNNTSSLSGPKETPETVGPESSEGIQSGAVSIVFLLLAGVMAVFVTRAIKPTETDEDEKERKEEVPQHS